MFICLVCAMDLPAQTFQGTNAPNSAADYSVLIGAGATNLSFSVGGGASAYSYVLVRKGSAPTDVSYDFSSQLAGQSNAIHLDQLDVSAGTYYVCVKTPSDSSVHAFSLIVETNRNDLRTLARPVSKSITGLASGLVTAVPPSRDSGLFPGWISTFIIAGKLPHFQRYGVSRA